MRTDAEIAMQIGAVGDGDFFGTVRDDLIGVLPFEQARPWLKDETTEDDWEPESRDRDAVEQRMAGYMEFAWGKALDHRGLSAGRSVDHFRAWLFLMGDDELLLFAEDSTNYPNYGVPILAAICDKYLFPLPEGEEVTRMREGLSCEEGCTEGCGR